MKSFISKIKNIPSIYNSFTVTEKTIFLVFLAIFIYSSLVVIARTNDNYLVEIPERGGVLKEGLIGTPRLINPLLAISDTDRDLVRLTYSGLMRATVDNNLIPDIAESYEISEDGLEYTFYIKEDVTFHDKQPVTADDVIFTIISAQNPELKSSKRSNWEGVSIEKIDDKTIVFRLAQPYAPFLQNTTLGILPKHLWGEININEFSLNNFNTSPIGSGPYKISKIKKDSIGIPTSYILESFKDFSLGEPNIAKLQFYFARNQEELLKLYKNGTVDAIHGINPTIAKELRNQGVRVETFPLPRMFGFFLNQDQAPVLSSNTVRTALNIAAPKEQIVEEVLSGFGSVIESPVPANLIEKETEIGSTEKEDSIAKAEQLLLNAGWERNEDGIMILETEDEMKMLSFEITTGNVPEFVAAAEKTVEAWRKIGADVQLKIFEPTDLNSNVIRPRKYDALLFGLIIGRDLDFYAFWHSSQRNDPGLNIAGYTNIDVDKILEDIRGISDPEELRNKLALLDNEITKDVPAIFLYTPEFIYVLPYKIRGVEIGEIITSEDRFLNIYEWYADTDKIWKIFE